MRTIYSGWVRRSCHGRAIAAVSLRLFRRTTRCNLRNYPRFTQFWWPIIEARAALHQVSAEDLLLNPIFRWAFLARTNKLNAFENQLTNLEAALGSAQLQAFRQQLLIDIANHPVENDAHNRLLSAMTEIRATLRFSSEGYAITLIPRHKNQRTPDFRIDKDSLSSLVEVKYVRPPDKLEEYLLRWWQAQREVAREIPQGLIPHLEFEWEPIESREELSQDEITTLKDFFVTVFQEPDQARNLKSGRLNVRYVPNRRLPITPVPLHETAALSEARREGIFAKIIGIFEHASSQLTASEESHRCTIFLAINLSPDIDFLWRERFDERLGALRQELSDKGVQTVIEEVGYL